MRGRGSVFWCGIVAVLAASSPATAAPASPDGPYRVQMVYRVGSALAPFTISVVASSGEAYGAWFAVGIHRDGEGWTQEATGGYSGIVGAPLPRAYGVSATSVVPSCPGTPGCSYPVEFDGSRGFLATPEATSRYFVASTHARVRVEVDSSSWRVRDVVLPVRRVTPDRAASVGAGALGRAVEHFSSATTVGGRYGSAVFAAVPCDGGGTGSAVLTGTGASEPGDVAPPSPLRCSPTSKAGGYAFAYAPAATTWTLRGEVNGLTASDDRLFVLDFPRP